MQDQDIWGGSLQALWISFTGHPLQAFCARPVAHPLQDLSPESLGSRARPRLSQDIDRLKTFAGASPGTTPGQDPSEGELQDLCK